MNDAQDWASDGVLQGYFEALQDVFHARNVSEIPEFFVFPLVIYTPVGVTLVRDTEHFQSIVDQYRQALGARGVAQTALQVERKSVLSNQRMQAVVRYTDLSEDGEVIASTVALYFLMKRNDTYKIEMLEYLELPLPLEAVERIVH
ncbi:MAG: hypothetical protein AAF376_19165 [Pseudomonadota bacterium]